MSPRPAMPASQTTSVAFGPYSVRIFTSIDAKPKIAFVGKPFDVAIVSGRAKTSRYAGELASFRNSSREVSSATRLSLLTGRRTADGGRRDCPASWAIPALYAQP